MLIGWEYKTKNDLKSFHVFLTFSQRVDGSHYQLQNAKTKTLFLLAVVFEVRQRSLQDSREIIFFVI